MEKILVVNKLCQNFMESSVNLFNCMCQAATIGKELKGKSFESLQDPIEYL
jgi:hypothetical protein